MNIFRAIFTTDGSNFSHCIFNVSEVENGFAVISVVEMFIILFGFPINSYVIWLIGTGTGHGLAAEFFTLNLAVCEILICIQSIFVFFSFSCKYLWIAVYFLDGLALTGHPLFQCLICAERYLAVVHPVTFLKYKPLRYRVICCVTVWVAGFFSCWVNLMTSLFFFSEFFLLFLCAQFLLYLSFQLFCCVAVLRALKQSGPRERGRERNEENHMKRRAFLIILATTVTMLIVLFFHIILITLSDFVHNGKLLKYIGFFCFILAGLVQPLLFLYRMRKLVAVKCQ